MTVTDGGAAITGGLRQYDKSVSMLFSAGPTGRSALAHFTYRRVHRRTRMAMIYFLPFPKIVRLASSPSAMLGRCRS